MADAAPVKRPRFADAAAAVGAWRGAGPRPEDDALCGGTQTISKVYTGLRGRAALPPGEPTACLGVPRGALWVAVPGCAPVESERLLFFCASARARTLTRLSPWALRPSACGAEWEARADACVPPLDLDTVESLAPRTAIADVAAVICSDNRASLDDNGTSVAIYPPLLERLVLRACSGTREREALIGALCDGRARRGLETLGVVAADPAYYEQLDALFFSQLLRLFPELGAGPEKGLVGRTVIRRAQLAIKTYYLASCSYQAFTYRSAASSQRVALPKTPPPVFRPPP